nr:flagellar basal-body MS-ring/collar protein FliF [Jannaschia sp. S6380]
MNKRRLAILSVATLVTFAAVLGLARLATAPRMELLFAGLEPSAAAEVVASLDGMGATYEVRGDSIHVDGAMRDDLRMRLAGEGLPRTDGAGYEILDGLTGFGTTSQMFDAAYWRAREGELTRTILASPGIRTARVHLATADSSPFSRDRSATAAVTLQMKSGAVDASLARAVQTLVAGAVRNLAAEDVAVIDAATGRVVGSGLSQTEDEARDTRMVEMRAAVENLLAARVGQGRYVVELALETRKDRETITERVLDPESRVVISTDTEERNASDQGGAGAGVTVASNLPDGDAAEEGGSRSTSAETRERVNYDFSATERQIQKEPGAIERLTVAVLVDGERSEGEDGSMAWTPRSDAELEVLRDLVRSAVGFREDRGDTVTVRSMEFELPADPAAAPTLSLPRFSGGQIAQMVTALSLAGLGIACLVFLVRPLLSKGLVASLPSPEMAIGSAGSELDTKPRELPQPEPAAAAIPANLPASTDRGDLPGLGDAGDGGQADADDPVDRLRQLIADRREETIEVLRGWMDEPAGETR